MPTMLALCACKVYISDVAKAGKQALTKDHRSRIQTKSTTQILASIDFDEATCAHFPQHARWDYLLEVKQSNKPTKTVAVEFHSVEFTRVVKKQRDSLAILTAECDPTPKIAEWILAPEGDTGGYAVTVRRKLAQLGIRTAGRSLEL